MGRLPQSGKSRAHCASSLARCRLPTRHARACRSARSRAETPGGRSSPSSPRARRGIWLRIGRKGSGVGSIDHPQALEAAICFGWIDGQKASYDERWWLQRFGPRAARSRWSKVNRAKAEQLIEQGLMQPAGLREVERARADGRWDAAYDAQSVAQVPDDLASELDARPGARAFFESLDSRNRYAVLYRIQDAKRPETRPPHRQVRGDAGGGRQDLSVSTHTLLLHERLGGHPTSGHPGTPSRLARGG